MQIVVDASIVMAVLFNEASKATILEKTRAVNLVSPSSLPWEVGNAISASVKRNRITVDQAVEAIQQFQTIHVRLIGVDLEDAIRLSSKYLIYAYDAYVLSCARQLKYPLICLDTRMAMLAEKIGIQTLEV